MLLDAPFVAVIQIIVYAGAIMVLFLFVVMLLNAPHEDTDDDLERAASGCRRPGAVRVFGALLALALAVELVWALTSSREIRRRLRRTRPCRRSPRSAGRCSPTTRSRSR